MTTEDRRRRRMRRWKNYAIQAAEMLEGIDPPPTAEDWDDVRPTLIGMLARAERARRSAARR